MVIVDKCMDWKKLNGSHSERLNVVQHLLGAKPRVRSSLPLRNCRMQLSKPARVNFINDSVIPWNWMAPRFSFVPIESLVDDHALRHKRCAIALIECGVVAGLHLIAEDCWVPVELPIMREGVWIQQQLIWVEAVSGIGFVGAMNAIPIDGPRNHLRQVSMPDLVRIFWQRNSLNFLFPSRAEKTNLYLSGVLGKKRKICTFTIPSCSSRKRRTFPDPEHRLFGHWPPF